MHAQLNKVYYSVSINSTLHTTNNLRKRPARSQQSMSGAFREGQFMRGWWFYVL